VFKESLGQSFDKVIHWRRPQDFMIIDNTEHHKEINVFHKEIEPSDIKPGQFSYKWILCALATLAERPGLVDRLFVTDTYKKNGTYRMRINKNGVWQELTIDDYMPCSLEGGPLFTRSHGNELWVMLLEKAYAKLHGGYQMLEYGHPNEAL
jgi:calpain-15